MIILNKDLKLSTGGMYHMHIEYFEEKQTQKTTNITTVAITGMSFLIFF